MYQNISFSRKDDLDKMKRVINDFKNNELILNAFYNSWIDTLVITSKDIHTGNKIIRWYEKPKVPIYLSKPDKVNKEHEEYAAKENLDLYYVPYKWREYEIARLLEIYDFADRVKSGAIERGHIHLDKRCFGTDLHIEDIVLKEYFKFCLSKDENGSLTVDFPKVDKFHLGGLDIETDIMVSDEPSEQPVIANTAIDNRSWKIKTVCLINEKYNGQKEIMENPEQFKIDFKKELIDHINKIDMDIDDPGKKKKTEESMIKTILEMVDRLDLDLSFSNDERDVIAEPVKFLMNNQNPDFVYIYNAKFDIDHMRMRSEKLKMDYDSLFKFQDKEAWTIFAYKNDDSDPKRRKHFYNANNPTKIVDQLLQYAQLRRSKLFASYSLAAVTQREIGVGKLDYTKITNYIGEFPYVDFKMFLIYNIIDVFIMLVLDHFTNDCYSQVYTRLNLCTEWGRIATPMARTTSVFDTLADIQGYISGNELNSRFLRLGKKRLEKIKKSNINLYNIIMQLKAADVDDPDDNPYRIKGGEVADPNKIDRSLSDVQIHDINVKNVRKLTNCADLDALAMYPNNIIANNGSKTTLIGILNSINGREGDNLPQTAALSLLNENIVSIGHNFFDTLTAEELIKDYYKVKPKYKKRLEEIEGFCEGNVLLKNSPFLNDYKKLIKALYKTRYDQKDKDAGAPKFNNYFFSNDSNKIKLSYYDTLIEMELEGELTFNQQLGIPGKGFICGRLLTKESILENHNHEYINMIPENMSYNLGNRIYTDVIPEEDIRNLTIAKSKPYVLKLGDESVDILDRLLFWNNNLAITPLSVNVYEIYGNNGQISKNTLLVKFNCSYNVGKTKLHVTQSMFIYRR